MDRKTALKRLQLDTTATPEQVVSAFRRMTAELDERMETARYESQKTAGRVVREELQDAFADALRRRAPSKLACISLAVSGLLIVAVGVAGVASPTWRAWFKSTIRGSDAPPAVETGGTNGDRMEYGASLPAATPIAQSEDHTVIAQTVRDALAALPTLETDLFGRVSEASRRVELCKQSAAGLPAGSQRDEINAMLQQAETDFESATRLLALADAHAFEASVVDEVANTLSQADRQFEAGNREAALATYRRAKERVDALHAWVGRADRLLRERSELVRETVRVSSSFGPIAQALPGVITTFDELSARLALADDALSKGDLQQTAARCAEVRERLSLAIAEATDGLLAKAQEDHRQHRPSAAMRALDELDNLAPAHAAATRLRAAISLHHFTNSIGLSLVFIPPRTFEMGSPPEEVGRDRDERRRTVTRAAGFYIGVTEITQSQWNAVMDTNPSQWLGDDLPVDTVSWDEALAFCGKLSERESRLYRMPTEAEWEYACRAGTNTPFSTGHTISTAQANYDGDKTYASGVKGEFRAQTTPVASFPPNAWGLYDMHGNLWEWCPDGLGDAHDSPLPPRAGAAELIEGRVLRGGSWRNRPRFCRSANRVRDTVGDRLNTVGLRVVLEAD